MLRKINKANIFIALYSAYLFMWSYKAGVISGILLLLIVIISIIYFFKTITEYKIPQFLKALNVLLLIFTIYGAFYIFWGDSIINYSGNQIVRTDYLKNIYASVLPIYPFFYFTRKEQINVKVIGFWMFVFMSLTIFGYYALYSRLLERASEAGSARTEFTNNYGYKFVMLLPLLFLPHKNKIIQYGFIVIALLFIIMAVKRGAILTGAVAIIYYIKSFFKLRTNKKIGAFCLLIVFAIIASCFIDNFIENDVYFSKRLNQTMDGETGREDIYGKIWTCFKNEDLLPVLFGNGANTSIKLTGMLAHNDWLEILINQGILGCLVYAWYFLVFCKTWRINRDRKSVV